MCDNNRKLGQGWMFEVIGHASWLKYIDNILKERGTNLKEVGRRYIEVYTSTESLGENVLLTDRT